MYPGNGQTNKCFKVRVHQITKSPHLFGRMDDRLSQPNTNDAKTKFDLVEQSNSIVSRASHSESFFRSAPMSLIQIYIPTEAALLVTAELGKLELLQFRDLNSGTSAFQKIFSSDIHKLDGLERALSVIHHHSKAEGIEIRSWSTISYAKTSQELIQPSQTFLTNRVFRELEEISKNLLETESRVLQLHDNQEELLGRYLHAAEWHALLWALNPYLTDYDSNLEIDSPISYNADDGNDKLELGGASSFQNISSFFVAGTVQRRKQAAFERVLWRALRGNVYIRSVDLTIDTKGLIGSGSIVRGNSSITTSKRRGHVNKEDYLEPKVGFLAYVHGKETHARLKKICRALGCTIFEIDSSNDRRNAMIIELSGKLDDLYSIIFNTRQAKLAVLERVSDSLEKWFIFIRKFKAIYDAMNHFGCDNDVATRRYFLAEAWCPSSSLPLIEDSIKVASERAGLAISPVISILSSPPINVPAPVVEGMPKDHFPPTYFATTKLTNAFQELTDAYGPPSYGEANPSLFMVATFPFLFAVMFGDLGHALMVTFFAGWMVLNEKRIIRLGVRKLGDIMGLVFSGRYVILLMGLFSIFTGLIYNDAFGFPLYLFPSSWTFVNNVPERVSNSYVYPFGIDPAWMTSNNMMVFVNSYKMKLSILLGFTQMVFGIFISASNQIHFGNWLDIYCTFLPQVLFMLSFFGYLCFLIIFKWIVNGVDASILNVFITMVLRLGGVDGPLVFPSQVFIQRILLVIGLVCIPWMFLAKPLYIVLKQKNQRSSIFTRPNSRNEQESSAIYHQANSNEQTKTDSIQSLEGSTNGRDGSDSVNSTSKKAEHDREGHNMLDVWMHQIIQSIEFVLGSLSNTASYLRLWALSLAHAELSSVLWNITIASPVTDSSPIKIIIFCPIWIGSTVAILLLMEGLSAFLHTLRLHWVEFNNKFYGGSGVKFEPFSLNSEVLMLAWNDVFKEEY